MIASGRNTCELDAGPVKGAYANGMRYATHDATFKPDAELSLSNCFDQLLSTQGSFQGVEILRHEKMCQAAPNRVPQPKDPNVIKLFVSKCDKKPCNSDKWK